MKILHVITSLGTGGAEKLMVDLLPRFKQMGHDVSLLLFDGTRTPFYDELENAGINIMTFGTGGSMYNPTFILKLAKILPQYDIVHTHNTACQYFASLAKRLRRCRTKIVTTEHNTFNRRRNIPILKHIDRLIYRKYDRIIAITEKVCDNLTDFIGDGFPISLIYNGIDLSRFKDLSANYPSDGKEIIVTMVAAFRPQKDQDTLIRAMAFLPSEYKLRLIGEGEREAELRELAKSVDNGNRILFLGRQSDIPRFLEESHILVLSSHWEGLSLSLLESMASGRPLIISDAEGLTDIAGDAALTVRHQSPEDLADAIKRLATDRQLYLDITRRCQAKASGYSIDKMADAYNNLYNRL